MSFVGKSIRLVLNTIPRPVLQRVAGWAVPVLGLFYAGKGRKCPICGCEKRKFLPYGYGKVKLDEGPEYTFVIFCGKKKVVKAEVEEVQDDSIA